MKKLETLEMMPTRIRIASVLRKAILSGEFQDCKSFKQMRIYKRSAA